MSNVLTQVEQVAPTDATVLILGETGTGKELIARAIHNTSKRKNNSLIKVNCAAIPSELIESELFGHIKGSFTGAIDHRIGKFELADGGTLFLDEIGELPLHLQPKLLRAIQEGEIEPIGSSKLKKLDDRIIAATNRDLKVETQEKRFREDLYFRLNVFPIKIPALRERADDIPVLMEHFVSKYCKKHHKQIKYISDDTLNQMRSYSWPGNIRELENLIERAIIICQEDLLVIPEFNNSSESKTRIKKSTATLAEVQRNHIIKVLNQTHWKIDGINGAAKLLDLKPSTLRDRMKKLGIKRIQSS
jgi:transcriptional regulator with GAF, ATPase, and Fis domain